jgi:osmoprotectant transport system ATP-binding protein
VGQGREYHDADQRAALTAAASDQETAMLELSGVCKRFGEVTALAPLSLAFAAGQTTALLGPSGCGKSTLLRIIVGLLAPDSGEVRFGGEPVTSENLAAIRRRMGYVIQDGGLFPHLSLRDNVTLMARHLRWDRGRIAAQLDKLCELTHLPRASLDRFPTQVSGGQRQRVSLMRALFLDPDVVLLDEPMGALDPLIRSELQKDLRSIFAALQKTVIIVTHDIGEAGFLAESMVLFREGRIVQRGTLHELAQRPQDDFVTRFINAQRSPLDSLESAP